MAELAPTGESTTVGEYQLLRRLGSGSMGEVWLGRHQLTDSFAAVKLLRQNITSRERVAKTFERERRAIARLGHPHIVSLFDVGPDWLATAYVDGTDLARRLKTPIDPAAAVHITLQIASALAHAHAHGVVHRDVKPSNILIDTAGNAFLADFGLAMLPEALDEEHHVGTPAFMAPEQARGEPAGPAADQYALGRTLLEMLVGGSLPMAPAEALAELPAELPAELRQAVARATAVAAAERFPSVSDFAVALGAVDLARYPAPRRLAPEVRVRTPFGWCVGADRNEMLAPDIQRADFRLSVVAAQSLLPADAVARFTERTGYSDIGWTVYGNTGRLGRLTDPSAFARATEIVVLVHGMFCNRESWSLISPAVCRDNAQSIMLAIDVLGFGESRFAELTPAPEHASPRGLVGMLTAWLELLGVRDLPTVLVGHSMAGASLLTVRDDELGERVSRLAITPVFPAVDRRYRVLLKMASGILPTLGAVKQLRKVMAKWFSSAAREYTEKERQAMALEFERAEPTVIARVSREYARSIPAKGDQLHRCMVLLGENDPVAPARILEPALDELGFPRTHIRRLTTTGGHFPHAEQRMHPEWTMRNVADLVACIGAMLRASSEGTPHPTEVASTMIGSSDV
jgi:serine/threonine protein kinase